jgi:hypothetical protein
VSVSLHDFLSRFCCGLHSLICRFHAAFPVATVSIATTVAVVV